jgi:hypothetical protein
MLKQFTDLLVSNRRKEIDPNDGIETNTERLIPGDTGIHKIRWHITEIVTGAMITSVAKVGWIAYQFSPIAHLHILIWCGLIGFCAYLFLERLNALLSARTWAIYSGFMILTGAALSFGFWMVLP